MLPALILALAALGSALLRLWAYRAQLLEMARVLEETPPESNLRLTVRTFGMAPRRLCRAVNQRLEEGRQLRLETQKREQELKELIGQFNDLKSDMPLVYTLREDFIRSMNSVDHNISGLDQKLDQVLRLMTSFGKEG